MYEICCLRDDANFKMAASLGDYKRRHQGLPAGFITFLSSLFVSIDDIYSLFYDIIVMVSFSYRMIRTVTMY